MRYISRRGFLTSSGAALGALPFVRSVDSLAQVTNPVFRHGVASGDPLSDRVILWTRVTPVKSPGAENVAWMVSRDEKFTNIVAQGVVVTSSTRDYCVKVDVDRLQPGTTYYYRFEARKERSVTGRTKTLPREDVTRVRLGVVSCSNLPQGYFNAYACLANRPDLDAILHLGDYLYEYANGQYGDGSRFDRVPSPDKEMVTLREYRERHAQYKADPDLQAIHRQHPFIVVWDDHEFTNNTWKGGAQNHNNDGQAEGDWMTRRTAALQAYYDWMPIREDAQTREEKIYRSFRFGNMATLMMLDTRLIGRDQQMPPEDSAAAESQARHLLGAQQEQWLAEQLVTSSRANATWTLFGQQVIFAPQTPTGRRPSNTDSWDGYRGARGRVFDMIERAKIRNLAILTGDVHSSWAFDLPRDPFGGYDKATGKGSLGVEFAGTSVTSPSNLGRGPDGPKQLADVQAARPHLHYVDGRYRGYFIVDLTRQRLQADYYAVASIEERTTRERFEKGFITESGRNHLIEASTPAS
ncbi:MAG TPA: alkaline phosphatase D family protein [Vicinamibacterales bacterium]|nr:alkaline phosphatase D family protein [Vicinamibacterales bacterium]